MPQSLISSHERRIKILKCKIKIISRKRTDNVMAKTKHEQRSTNYNKENFGLVSGAPKVKANPAPL